MHHHYSLAGTWQFQLDPDNKITPRTFSPERAIPVPLPWQAAFPELARYSGYAWYRRSVDVQQEWLAGDLLLRFGAVDYWCRVFFNGQLVGEHEGGYTPFEMSVREVARAGENEIVVQVYDVVQQGLCVERWPALERQEETQGPPFNAQDIPHGKQEWYINVGGIWQDVELIVVPAAYLDGLRVSTDIHSGQAQVVVELAGAAIEKGGAIRLSITAAGGEEVSGAALPLTAGQRTYAAALAVENPRLWWPEDPNLYTLTATLQLPGSEDELSTRFGFREISTRGGQILLNGEPFFLLCALDQDLYPDTIYTVPSEQFLRDQFQKARHLGLNSLRCHIKPPDPRYLDLADEMGLLIWAEIPSWRTFHYKPTLFPGQVALGESIKRRVEQTFEEMVKRDFNHPSLVIWTIVNEDWGTSLPLSSEDRGWVAQMYERCKQLDPTRLVVDNSACPHPWGPNIHVHTDLDDFHIYANIPDQARNFEQAIDQFALRPMWTYSNHGDATRSGQEPLVLSEFGNWGLPSLKPLREHYGRDPDWFQIGAWWSPWEGDAAWAKDVEERFRALGLDSIWGDYETFATATQWHQYHAMKFEIEAMRRQPSLAGYVITEFTDAYWESNGLLDFVRKPKAYNDAFSSINSPDVIVPGIESYAFWADQSPTVQLSLAHYGGADWAGARLRWKVEGSNASEDLQVPAMQRGEVRTLGWVTLHLPLVDETRVLQVTFALLDKGGDTLARNSLELLVMPARGREASYNGEVAVITRATRPEGGESSKPAVLAPDATGGPEEAALGVEEIPEQDTTYSLDLPVLGRQMAELGYKVSPRLTARSRLAVTNYPNAQLLQWVRDGGNLLFICDGPSPFFWSQHRTGAYSGSWITSFSWLRDRVHGRLKAANPLGLPFKRIMPRLTILGLPFDNPGFQGDFLAGMVSGWVHHPSAHTVQFRYGRGRVIMTTFALENGLLVNDPAAAAMVHDLVEYLCSDDCRPALAANY